MKGESELYAFLDELNISHETVSHKPCFTVAESEEVDKAIDAVATRNMFLRDKKKKYWLITLEAHQPVDLKKLKSKLNAKGSLSFGNAEKLWEMLGVKPGSVTPFSLINQMDGSELSFVLDKALAEAERVAAHPLRNDKTMVVTGEGLLKFLCEAGHDPVVVDFSELEG